MSTSSSSQSSIFASRLYSRKRLDLRAQLVTLHTTGEGMIVHGRTRDLSRSGAGLTLTRELPTGSEVMLCLRLPGNDSPLCLQAVITRRQGFRAGLRFVQPSAGQRLLLHELCYD